MLLVFVQNMPTMRQAPKCIKQLVNIESYANIMSTHADIARILYLLRNSDCGLMMKSSLSKLQRRSFFLSWKDVKPACLSLNHFRDDFFFPSSFIEITAAHCIKSPHFFALIVFMSAVCTCVLPICSMLPSFMSDINLLNATLQSIWARRQKQFNSEFGCYFKTRHFTSTFTTIKHFGIEWLSM